nr:MAG TPA_asm: hypothetical protein [Caudoviricetes sp.]
MGVAAPKHALWKTKTPVLHRKIKLAFSSTLCYNDYRNKI